MNILVKQKVKKINHIDWYMKRRYIDAAKSPWYEIILCLLAQRTPLKSLWVAYEGYQYNRLKIERGTDYVDKGIREFEPTRGVRAFKASNNA